MPVHHAEIQRHIFLVKIAYATPTRACKRGEVQLRYFVRLKTMVMGFSVSSLSNDKMAMVDVDTSSLGGLEV